MLKILSLLIFLLLGVTALAQNAEDKEAQQRLRVDGAAGGTGQQLSKEQREAVKNGERQHRTHREVIDRARKGERQEPPPEKSDRQKGGEAK